MKRFVKINYKYATFLNDNGIWIYHRWEYEEGKLYNVKC